MPSRQEAWAKYVITVSNCHYIHERNITVVALLAYATQRAQVARNNLQSAIKEEPTEEILHAKIAEHACYIDLVEIILDRITDISTEDAMEWKEQHDTVIRNRNKEKVREMLENK